MLTDEQKEMRTALDIIQRSLESLSPRCKWGLDDCACDMPTNDARERYRALLRESCKLEVALGY